MHSKTDFYFAKTGKWQQEFILLRGLISDCGLTEDLKWGHPCYTFQKRNIVLIHGFKDYCAVLFFKGALLKDRQGILVQQTENVQAARQVRFSSLQEIRKNKHILKSYITEAIEVEKAGLKVPLRRTEDYRVPEEFQKILSRNKALKNAFNALTPGRQRGYLFYFSAPKLSATRLARIEKYAPLIL